MIPLKHILNKVETMCHVPCVMVTTYLKSEPNILRIWRQCCIAGLSTLTNNCNSVCTAIVGIVSVNVNVSALFIMVVHLAIKLVHRHPTTSTSTSTCPSIWQSPFDLWLLVFALVASYNTSLFRNGAKKGS